MVDKSLTDPMFCRSLTFLLINPTNNIMFTIIKKTSSLAAAGLLALSLNVSAADKLENSELLETLGWFMSQNLVELDLSESELASFMKGFNEGLKGAKGPEDIQNVGMQLSIFLRDRTAEVQKKRNEAFFAELDKKANVKKSPSGLYYEIIEEGEGPHATVSDSVTVHYKGELIDGTVFDSSYSRGEPNTFPLSGVVPGFAEGVQLLGKGGKARIYIPSNLGYGDEPNPGSPIPPGATLVFDIELLDIKKQ